MGTGRFFFELYALLAIVHLLIALVALRVFLARKVANAGARGSILAAPIGAGAAWLLGIASRLPLEVRPELATQWSKLVPLALGAAIPFGVVWLALRTKQRPFRTMFAALVLLPATFVGSVVWSIANLLADDRLHGVGATFDARKEHALWVGVAFAVVGLLVGAFLARVAATPDVVETPEPVNDDEPAPSRGARAVRRRRRRS